MPIYAYMDSATGYNLVTSVKDPSDLTRKSDLLTLQRALLDSTMVTIHYKLGDHKPADALFKPTWSRPKPKNALKLTLRTGLLDSATTSHTSSDTYRNAPRDG